MGFISEHEKEVALNKFASDSLTDEGLFHISHRYYHSFCYVASQLELVLRSKNDDRIICKNGNRETEGGCNALISCHSFNYCYLHFS